MGLHLHFRLLVVAALTSLLISAPTVSGIRRPTVAVTHHAPTKSACVPEEVDESAAWACDDGTVDNSDTDLGANGDGVAGWAVRAQAPIRQGVLDDHALDASQQRAVHRIWDRFAQFAPPRYRAMVGAFQLLGPAYQRAWVEERDDGTWVLAVGGGLRTGWELDYALVHELGHLLTLNVAQLRSSGPSTCPTYRFVPEGCPRAGGLTERYVRRFWPAALRRSLLAGDDLWERSPELFVSDYAATDIAEDMAESWAFFVLEPSPSPGTTAADKVTFLAGEPALVAVRSSIRELRVGW